MNEWCKSGVSKHAEELQDLSIKDYPWLCDKTKSRIPVLINSVNDVPRSSKALRMQMHEAGTKSMMVVPLINRDHVLGCLRIEATLSERQWSSSEHEGFNLVAEILASVLSHLQAEQDIRDNHRNFHNMIAYAPVAMFAFNCKVIVHCS